MIDANVFICKDVMDNLSGFHLAKVDPIFRNGSSLRAYMARLLLPERQRE